MTDQAEAGTPLVRTFACDGHDRHTLSLQPLHAVGYALAGATLIVISCVRHVYGRGMGIGIALMLVPVVAFLFARSVNGPVLYYRSWGRLHQLPLRTVTAVEASTGKGRVGEVLLSAPSLQKPLRLSVSGRRFVMPAEAREHLRGWLSAPEVQWDPRAATIFDGSAPAQTTPDRPQRRALLGLTVVLPVVVLVASLWIAHEEHVKQAIAGAPGYHRPNGPDGKPLAVGHPWGPACQPVRFTVEEHVPDWVYNQAAAVVAEARRDGIDVTIEDRSFMWRPSSLYYVRGQAPSTTERVGIFAHDEDPPSLPSGGAEHIELGWDAGPDPDGHDDDLTDVQGILWMKALGTDPLAVRLAIRQLVAMTQGIVGTSRHDSGIARGSTLDAFSAQDVAAMKLMSGCSGQAA